MASRYDDELWELVPDDWAPPPEALRRFVRGLPAAESALDLGCGDGRLTLELQAHRLTAADVSRVALDRAAKRLAGRDAHLVEVAPDVALPFADGTFDLVLCAETIEHVRDVQLLLSEARRVLRAGGRLAATTPAHGRVSGVDVTVRGFERRFDPFSPHLRFFTRRSLGAALTAMGFEVELLRRGGGTLYAVARR